MHRKTSTTLTEELRARSECVFPPGLVLEFNPPMRWWEGRKFISSFWGEGLGRDEDHRSPLIELSPFHKHCLPPHDALHHLGTLPGEEPSPDTTLDPNSPEL